jgi:hypothetical protein
MVGAPDIRRPSSLQAQKPAFVAVAYSPNMESTAFTDFMLLKLLGLGALAFAGNFVYTLITGRSLTADRRDKEAVTPPQQRP